MQTPAAFAVMDAEAFSEINGKNLDAAARTGTALLKGAMSINQEIMTFMGKRLQHDMETAQCLANCKNGEEAFRLQANFVEGAIKQYADEAAKILAMAADVTKESMTPFEERTEETLHDMNDAGKPA